MPEISTKDKDNSTPCFIKRLPYELLSLIFFHSLPEDVVPSPAEAPLKFGRVCRLWRKISIHDKSLWTSLCIIGSASRKFKGKRAASGIKSWLQKSGNLPLDLRFWYVREEQDGILKVLCEHVSHWGNIEFWLRRKNLDRFNFTSITSDWFFSAAPKLTHLSLNWEPYPRLYINILYFDFSNLHNLYSYKQTSDSVHQLILPQTLKRLTLLTAHDGHIVDIFESCPYLEYVDISASHYDYFMFSPPPITMASLKEIMIHDEGGAAGVLRSIQFPNISSLKFRGGLPGPTSRTPMEDSLSSALERSRTDLRHLVFGGPLLSDEEILRCLQLSPGLVELVFEPIHPYDPQLVPLNLLQELSSTTSILCPSLQVLKLLVFDFELPPSTFSSLLQRRWLNIDIYAGAYVRLQQIRITHHVVLRGYEDRSTLEKQREYISFFQTDPVMQRCFNEGFRLELVTEEGEFKFGSPQPICSLW